MILESIVQLLTIEEIRTIFCNQNFLKKLPFNQDYDNEILDIMYMVVKYSPETIDDDIRLPFTRLTKKNPSKCLVILAIYSQSYDKIDILWGFFDTLFKNAIYFEIPELIPQYFTLIVFLVQNHDDFCDGRLEVAWNTVCKALLSKDHLQSLQT